MNKEKSSEILNRCIEYIKNLLVKQDKDIRDLREKYKVDKEMGYKCSYKRWLEIRYVELDENFKNMNRHRIELIVEKFERG